MTATLRDALQALNAAFPDGFDSCVNFEITGLGCLSLDSTGARIGEGSAETVLRADAETFAAIISGSEDPAPLFFSGRLKIEGDLGTAMRLGRQL